MKLSMKYAFMLASLLLVVAAPVAKAVTVDLTGTWEGAYYTPAVGYQTATAELIQAAGAVSGTYTSSTGLNGSLSGTVAGETMEFTIVHSGGCEGFFYGKAVLDGEVLRIAMGGADCASIKRGPVTAVLARNLDDSVHPWISLDKVRHGNGSLTGGLWCGLNHPHPDTINSVSLVTPGGLEIAMVYDEDDDRWETQLTEFPADKTDTLFPNGIYLFEIDYLNGTTATAGAVHAADYPAAYPVVTSPVHGALIDPAADLVVSWEAADASVGDIWIDPGDGETSKYPSSITQITIPGGSLPDNGRHYIWLSFSNTSPQFFGNKELVSQPYFFTGNRLVESWLGLVKAEAPSGQSGMLFMSDLESVNVTSASLITPGAETLPYGHDGQDDRWGLEVKTSASEAAWRFPDGTYQVGANFSTGQAENRSIQLSGSFPLRAPRITSPVNGTMMDKGTPALVCQWDPWTDGTGFISVEVKKIAAIPVDNGFDSDPLELTWESMLAADATRLSVPTALLDPDSAYELGVMFINSAGAGAYKVNRSHVFFQTNCYHELSHTHMGFDAAAGSDQIIVSAANCFDWRATSNAGWIRITSGGGLGDGELSYSVTENWRNTDRQGTLNIAGETFNVYQLAGETVCLHAPFKLGGNFYETFHEGYAAAADGDTIRCQYGEIPGAIDFDRDVDVTLVGGYNCDYIGHPDFTTVQGRMVFSRGTVTVDGLIVAEANN